MIKIAFYDTKPYDRQYFERASTADRLRWQFHELRLTSETAASVDGAQAVCVFVNDQAFLTCETLTEIARVTTENLRCLAEAKPFLSDSVLVNSPTPQSA